MAKKLVIFVLFFIMMISRVFAQGSPQVRIECNNGELLSYLYAELRPQNYFINKNGNQLKIVINVMYEGNQTSGSGWYGQSGGSSSTSGWNNIGFEFYAEDSNGVTYGIANGRSRGRQNLYISSSYSGNGWNSSSSNNKNKFEVGDLVDKLNSWIPPRIITQASRTGSFENSGNRIPELPLYQLDAGQKEFAQAFVGQIWNLKKKTDGKIVAIIRVAEYNPDTAVIRFEYVSVFELFKLEEIEMRKPEVCEK